MGDWKGYISAVLRDQRIDGVAIVGHSDNRCVWASRPGGLLAAISPQEAGVLTGPGRAPSCSGAVRGGPRCCGSKARDHLLAGETECWCARGLGWAPPSAWATRLGALLVLMERRACMGAFNKTMPELIHGLRVQGT